LGSAASWGTAKSGTSSVDLPGDSSGNGYVAGSSSAVDTTRSFTVSAWVYLDHTTLGAMSRVALSQSATIKSGFMLRYNYYGQQWEFAVGSGTADDYSPAVDSSYSAGGSAALTTWTHLAGVYDAATQQVTLYVNGVAQTSASHTSAFNATGPFQVGRVKEFGGWLVGPGLEAWGPWAGRVDDARAYRRALDAAEITALYNGANSGNSLGMPGALQGAQQGQSNSSAQAFASIARASYDPVPASNPTSYTLECWFRTRGVSGAGQTLLAFGSEASGDSGIADRRLYLDTSGRITASTSSGVTAGATTASTFTDGNWHHVAAAVSPAQGVKLYVDGGLAATAAYTAPGNFAGYWRWGGDTPSVDWPADYYDLGDLDEVAVYTTALSADQIATHYHANH
jgi:hypothetical protein